MSGGTTGRGVGLAVILGLVAAAAPAAAQTAAPAESLVGQAQALFRQGVASAERGDLEWALRAFRASYTLNPVDDVLYNIGSCEQALEHFPAAANAFQEYVVDKGEQISEDDRVEIEGYLAELALHVGRINVDCSQDGASVWVDGAVPGRTPLGRWLAVEPGRHVVAVDKPGFFPRTGVIELVAGGTYNFVATLEPIPGYTPAPPPASPAAPPEIPPLPGTVPPETGSGIEPAAEATDLEPWFWTMVAVTGAATSAAFITGGLAVRYRDDYTSGGRLDTGLYDTTLDLRTATDALIGVASAAAVAALLLFLLDDEEETPPDATSGVEVGLSSSGLAFEW